MEYYQRRIRAIASFVVQLLICQHPSMFVLKLIRNYKSLNACMTHTVYQYDGELFKSFSTIFTKIHYSTELHKNSVKSIACYAGFTQTKNKKTQYNQNVNLTFHNTKGTIQIVFKYRSKTKLDSVEPTLYKHKMFNSIIIIFFCVVNKLFTSGRRVNSPESG